MFGLAQFHCYTRRPYTLHPKLLAPTYTQPYFMNRGGGGGGGGRWGGKGGLWCAECKGAGWGGGGEGGVRARFPESKALISPNFRYDQCRGRHVLAQPLPILGDSPLDFLGLRCKSHLSLGTT